MCDQLRQDYLSCYGHQTLDTPNIDALAKRGVRFENAYCQAPLCAPSRASFYTGRYQSSHGVQGNEDATLLGEYMMGDYLRALGYRAAVVGKTHSFKSKSEIKQWGIDPDSDLAKTAKSGGFEPYEHHEGMYPDPILPKNLGYTNYLHSVGYTDPNPWQTRANSGIDQNGNIHSGWALRNSVYPAALEEEHTETAFATNRAMDFIRESKDQPWCLHLSYIKPHWPLIAPDPYHNMFSRDDIQEVVRSKKELENPHPVIGAFLKAEYSQNYANDEIRDIVLPVYMGLTKQVDDHIGRLIKFLQNENLLSSTMIVFTADHGDYLGDHWLGEKDLFHEPSAKLPFIVVDPDVDADCTRNTVRTEFVEAVDIVPTFVEFAGGEICRERVEGFSLLPLLRSTSSPEKWRDYTVSEIDYADRGARYVLGIDPYQCHATMIRDARWKYIHYHGYDYQLFDLEHDPNELNDLGQNSDMSAVIGRMKELLFDWQYTLKRRVGMDYEYAQGQGPERDEEFGIIIGRE